MSWSYPRAPETAAWQFVLCPMPVSYALPPGVDAIPEGLLRSLSGHWPLQGWTNSLFGNYSSVPVSGNNIFVHGAGGGGGGGVPVVGQACSSMLKKATDGGVPDPGVGVYRTAPSVSGVQSSCMQTASTDQGTKQEEKKPKDSGASGSTSGSGAKKRDLSKLLEGFRVTEETRKSGKTIGHKDKYYVHIETGKRLRSLEEVERFKLTGSIKKQKPIADTMNGNATDMTQLPQQPLQQVSQQDPNVQLQEKR